MKSKILSSVVGITSTLLLASALMAFTGTAAATPVLQGTTTEPTGVTGLVVDGSTYDVTITTNDSYNYVFGSQPLIFPTATSAGDAMLALQTFLNTTGVSDLYGGDYCYLHGCAVLEPYADIGGMVSVAATGIPAPFEPPSIPEGANPWSGAPAPFGFQFPDFLALQIRHTLFGLEWAVFTPEATRVPEPATLSLVGLCLAGIGFARRRKMT